MSSVVFVTIEDLSKTSGSGVATREIVRAIGSVSEEPMYVLCPTPTNEIPARLKNSVHEFRFLPPETNSGEPIWHANEEMAIFRQLWRLFRQKDPSIVVTRLSPSTLSPAPLCRLFGIPHILLIRGWVNRNDEYGDTKFSSLVEQIVRMNVRLSEEVYVAFEELREWVERYRGEAQSPVQVLPNAVDPQLFSPMSISDARDELNLDKDDFVVGFVGSLAKRHELPTLLEATAQIKDVQTQIVGDGELRQELERLATEYEIEDRVTFTGRVPHEEVPKYIAAFDVGYGVVSHVKASNPIKCYEYLSCHRPVISTNTSEMSFISETESGILVEEINRFAIKSAIEKLQHHSRDQRVEMGKRGGEHVQKNATWKIVAQNILAMDKS